MCDILKQCERSVATTYAWFDSVKSGLRRYSEGQDDLFKKDIYNFDNFSLTAF